ncbi:hypothetical protein BDV98DRAFT_571235, partial [Pterulicium gracile]
MISALSTPLLLTRLLSLSKALKLAPSAELDVKHLVLTGSLASIHEQLTPSSLSLNSGSTTLKTRVQEKSKMARDGSKHGPREEGEEEQRPWALRRQTVVGEQGKERCSRCVYYQASARS